MGKDFFEREYPRIQKVIQFVAARNRLDPSEREELASYVAFKLIEDDYRRLRQFRGESRLETYLNVVVQRLFLDFRSERWGKWRPSSQAKTLGKPAVLVERLLYRDGLPQSEVFQAAVQHGERLEEKAFDAIVQGIPCRPRRTRVGSDSLATFAGDGGELSPREREVASRKIEETLGVVIRDLPSEDCVLLKLRFLDGCTIREIAAALGVSDRALYPRMQRLFRRLRRALEEKDVHAEDARVVWSERIDVDVESALAHDHLLRTYTPIGTHRMRCGASKGAGATPGYL